MNIFEVVIRGNTLPIEVEAERVQNVPGFLNFTVDGQVVGMFNENDVVYTKIVQSFEEDSSEDEENS